MTPPRRRRTFHHMPRPLKRPNAKKAPFGAHLFDLIERNQDARRVGGEGGPTSASDVAKWISAKSERVVDATVLNWIAGRNLPGGDYIVAIEQLFGMPWVDLVNPAAPLASPDQAALYRDWIRLSPERRAAALTDARHVPARRGGAG